MSAWADDEAEGQRTGLVPQSIWTASTQTEQFHNSRLEKVRDSPDYAALVTTRCSEKRLALADGSEPSLQMSESATAPLMEDEECPALGTSFVKESPLILARILSLCSPDSTITLYSSDLLQLTKMIEKYQEQPTLLDPHLEEFLKPLMTRVREIVIGNVAITEKELVAFRVIFTLCKVRGHKTAAHLFPHEVDDLERTLAFLEHQNRGDFATWEVRYVLLLWLSIIVLIPFGLKTVDNASTDSTASAAAASGAKQTLQRRLVTVGRSYLSDPGITRTGAALLMTSLLTRPDMASELAEFVTWCGTTLTDSTDQYLVTGVFASLAGIFQKGSRAQLAEFVPLIFGPCLQQTKRSTNNRKLSLKLIQRIALVLLKPMVPKWKYSRRNLSLLANLGQGGGDGTPDPAGEEENEDYEIPDQLEDIIQLLLDGLRDKDTVVRWSAAKGLGRLNNRLPLSLADEIVGSVFELFSPREPDAAWHGACLAVAELARRGLLLPDRLHALMPKLVEALVYDINKGTHTTGAHVRDGACYVSWAIARAYEPEVLKQHINTLASTLITTTLYDREVNCRRAAAAAFQEHVGRQGSFPHGIDIIGLANFFTLSNRSECYLTIAPQIAAFEEYKAPLLAHLLNTKVTHIDRSLRELTSKALRNLAPIDPQFMLSSALPKLLKTTTASDVNIRHGSVLAVAEIVGAFGALKETTPIPAPLSHQIREVPLAIERARLYRGRGAEMIREAVNRLIECIAEAKLNLKLTEAEQLERDKTATTEREQAGRIPVKTVQKGYLTSYLETLEENLKHPHEEIQVSAVAALRGLAESYWSVPTEQQLIRVTDKFTKTIDTVITSRRGFCWGLGSLTRGLLVPRLQSVLDTLNRAAQLEADLEIRDAETRRNAIHALAEVVGRVGLTNSPGNGVSQSMIGEIMVNLLSGVEDYSADNRGDVGSWVREAAIGALVKITLQIAEFEQQNPSNAKWLTEETIKIICQRLAQHSNEKIDKMRGVAGKAFETLLLQRNPTIPFIPRQEEIVKLREKHLVDGHMDWSSSKQTFPFFVDMLEFEEYTAVVLSGLARSVGGKNNNKSLIDDSTGALTKFLRAKSGAAAELERLGRTLIAVLTESSVTIVPVLASKVSNVTEAFTSATLRTIEVSLATGAFYRLPDSSTLPLELIDAVKREMVVTKSIDKIFAAVPLVGCLLPFKQNGVREQALELSLGFLGHKYPIVRKSAAEVFYTQIETYSTIIEDQSVRTNVSELLLITKWDGTDDLHLQVCRQLYELLNITPPVLEKKTAAIGDSKTPPTSSSAANTSAAGSASPSQAPTPDLPLDSGEF